MKKWLLPILLLFIVLITCKKETINTLPKYPFTGTYSDTTLTFIPLQYSITHYNPYSCFENYGSDSFKTSDSSIGIMLHTVYYDKKRFDSCCGLIKCQPDKPQYFAMRATKGDIEFCVDPITAVSTEYNMLNKLYRNTQIDDQLTYASGDVYFFNLFSPNAGDWNKASTEKKFVGLRKKYLGTYKYGWMQISVKNNTFTLDTLAFQK